MEILEDVKSNRIIPTMSCLYLADARRKQKEDELLALALGQSRVMAPQPFAAQRPLYTGML